MTKIFLKNCIMIFFEKKKTVSKTYKSCMCFKIHKEYIHLLNRTVGVVTHSYYSNFRGEKKAAFQRITPLIIIWYFHNYTQMSSLSSLVALRCYFNLAKCQVSWMGYHLYGLLWTLHVVAFPVHSLSPWPATGKAWETEATLERSTWAQVTSHAYYIYKPHINTETTWCLFPALVFCTVAYFCYVMFYILFTSNCSVSKLKNSKHMPHKMHFSAEVCRSIPVTLEPESWDVSVGAVHALDCG